MIQIQAIKIKFIINLHEWITFRQRLSKHETKTNTDISKHWTKKKEKVLQVLLPSSLNWWSQLTWINYFSKCIPGYRVALGQFDYISQNACYIPFPSLFLQIAHSRAAHLCTNTIEPRAYIPVTQASRHWSSNHAFKQVLGWYKQDKHPVGKPDACSQPIYTVYTAHMNSACVLVIIKKISERLHQSF